MRRSRNQRGFTLIELMIVVAIVGLLTAAAAPMYSDAVRRARESALAADGKKIYAALMRYSADNGSFPSDDELDTATLNPLASEGHLPAAGVILNKLVDNELSIYVAPDVGGPDQHFIAIMRSAADPSLIAAVVHTNIIPTTGGWVDGVYIITNGELEETGM